MKVKIRELINTPCSILNETVRFDSQGIGEITKAQYEHLTSVPYFKVIEVIEPQPDNCPNQPDDKQPEEEAVEEVVEVEVEEPLEATSTEAGNPAEQDTVPVEDEPQAPIEEPPKKRAGRPRLHE